MEKTAIPFPIKTPWLFQPHQFSNKFKRIQTFIKHSDSSKASILEAQSSSLSNQTDVNWTGSILSFSDDELKKPISVRTVKLMRAQIVRLGRADSLHLFKKLFTNSNDLECIVMLFFQFFGEESSLFSLLDGVLGELRWERVLKIVAELHRQSFTELVGVLSCALKKVCVDLQDLNMGAALHAFVVKNGCGSDAFIASSLLKMYGDSCMLVEARKLFDETPYKTMFFRDLMIEIYVKNQFWVETVDLFRETMQLALFECSVATAARTLQACGRLHALREGKQIHGYAVRRGLFQFIAISNSLVSMYSKTGQLESASQVFRETDNRDSISWNSMISGYVANGSIDGALKIFQEMESLGTKPDLVTWNSLIFGHALHGSSEEVEKILRTMNLQDRQPNASTWSAAISGFSRGNYATNALALFKQMVSSGIKLNASCITSILQAVGEQGTLRMGKEIQGYMNRHGFHGDVCMTTSLIEMYVKHNRFIDARRIFDNMKFRNSFTLNALISGYAHSGHFDEALELLNHLGEGLQPDLMTWNSLISGYSLMGKSKQALLLIRQLKRTGMTPNVVSWTALISGSSKARNHRDALDHFKEMQKARVKPNHATIASLIAACAGLASLHQGAELHCYAIKNGLDDYIYIASALIDMYAKSGHINNAQRVFSRIRNRNTVSWNAMINGYSIHRLGRKAISVYEDMCDLGFHPDAATFTSLLSACSHSGLLDEGWKLFDRMREDHHVIPTIEHYACMIDLLGRNGYLDEAVDLIRSMPLKPDAGVWGSLLGACKVHRDVKIAEFAANHLLKLEPYNSTNYSLLMSLYATEERFDEIENLRDIINVVGAKKRTEWSWIRINREVHVFSAKGMPHREIGEIYFELFQLVAEMRRLGYSPATSCVVQNVDDHRKEKLLFSHTEKLAITYGLIKTGEGVPIRVTKNTTMCGDCHEAAKYISRITGRRIFLRDGCIFHEFSNGKCSCTLE